MCIEMCTMCKGSIIRRYMGKAYGRRLCMCKVYVYGRVCTRILTRPSTEDEKRHLELIIWHKCCNNIQTKMKQEAVISQ